MKFFRIITADITTRSKLRLPGKFLKRYGANMPGSVSLQVPTGAKWRVEVQKKKDEFWLGKGWFEFAESLGIKYGHFLMFDYDAMHAVFYVVLIGTSAAEVEYPAVSSIDEEYQGGSASAPKCLKLKEEEEEDDARLGRNGNQAPFCEYLRNEGENMSGDSPIASEDERAKTDDTILKKGTLGGEIILNSKGRILCVVQGRKVKQTSSDKPLARAKSFKAEEPVCIITMQPSYVIQESNNGIKKKCQLLFPLCFIEAYFNLKNMNGTLRTNSGKTWPVKCRITRKQAYFTYGWRQFAIDNYLKAGDVCLFELIRADENALKVAIFRAMDDDDEALK